MLCYQLFKIDMYMARYVFENISIPDTGLFHEFVKQEVAHAPSWWFCKVTLYESMYDLSHWLKNNFDQIWNFMNMHLNKHM